MPKSFQFVTSDACSQAFRMTAPIILRALFERSELVRSPLWRSSFQCGRIGRQWLWLLSPKGK